MFKKIKEYKAILDNYTQRRAESTQRFQDLYQRVAELEVKTRISRKRLKLLLILVLLTMTSTRLLSLADTRTKTMLKRLESQAMTLPEQLIYSEVNKNTVFLTVLMHQNI